MNITFDFTGRSVLLTGATGGIGHAIAQLFNRAGADLLLADLNADMLQQSIAGMDGPGRIRCISYDAAETGASQRVADVAREDFGGIDVLVPAAGIYPTDTVAEMTYESLHRAMQINLMSVTELVRDCIPLFRDGSSIVLMSSIAAHRGSVGHGHYAMTKAGVLALARTLAQELGPHVRANAVSPGTIDTPMARPNIERMGDRILAATPQGRFGTPEEVAATVAFLASDGAGFITGENIHINGGWYIG